MSQAEDASQAHQSVNAEQAAPAVAPDASSSCRKKKSESGTFIGDVLDHIDEFVHASLDEHKTCFKKTLNKVLFLARRRLFTL